MSEAMSDAGTRSVPTLLRDLVNEVSALIRTELSMARVETRENLERASGGAVRVAAGALVSFAALLVLLQALVVALANVLPPSVASLVVGVVVAIVGYALIRNGQNDLKAKSVAPTRTYASVTSATHAKEASR